MLIYDLIYNVPNSFAPDIILTGNDNQYLQDLIHQLNIEFAIKDLGALHYFLGIEVHSVSNGIMLSQRKYAQTILQKAGMLEASFSATPMALASSKTRTDDTPVDATSYHSITGSLLYLTLTRLDLVQAVNKVCQHFQNPTIKDFKEVKRMLRYLVGITQFGITFYKNNNLHLYAFCDANWGGCPITRRSTTGFCVYLGSNIISWSSKKKPTVARSSSEVEY